jgi:HSP20 family protein
MTTNPQNEDQTTIVEKELGQLSVDVYDTSNELIIIAPIAGVKMENINLTVTDDVLTIDGHRELQHQVKSEDYVIQECFWGEFSRSIVLPDNVDTTKINASFKDGVLKINIPKIAGNLKTKLIKIKSA